jgi:hypothetical protein
MAAREFLWSRRLQDLGRSASFADAQSIAATADTKKAPEITGALFGQNFGFLLVVSTAQQRLIRSGSVAVMSADDAESMTSIIVWFVHR